MPSASLCHQSYFDRCAQYGEVLVPVAAISERSKSAIRSEIDCIKDIGYKAVKIHPRSLNLALSNQLLREMIDYSFRRGLVVFLCSYLYSPLNKPANADPYSAVIDLLRDQRDFKLVLLHGGDVQLMQFAQLVRHNPELLLDLSHTMVKYKGSSMDQDLRFLFRSFDQRICIGSDHPEWDHQTMRERFEEFGSGLAKNRLQSIAYSNLERFLNL